ncbi:DegT/DnrJ/EryC1/StrS family aminotransferase [Alloacidobacterium dinghuense]|uniref:DegT/DnrJ/EryC1/StrS family aminotransferase n=1 Tax=Alloacidobacterium dinghuense TaxID=2763107 RepID=A0A7G8BQ60_9BACT|nr:DegT/DnrJ/EryC1/StrS family aminotransferase [Alloacidobacterium dinghuense]QNI34680.1 DegT/DnrJ/EryC1/StrS family aminotransferase [Alloacidobacterium dinghuense]
MNIPLSQPDITEAEIEAVVAVLRSSRLSIGPKQEEFEHLLATDIGVPHAVAVSSGTAGLHLCIRALGIGKEDEVIVPSFAFVSAANAIRYEGATPVFVDIEPATLNMDPARIEEALTPRTRAILAVHTFGCPADMDAILDIARRHRLLVIEDCCEAIGAEYRGQRVGSFGDAAVFAFYPNKQITMGEGGVVVTRNADMARDIRALRNQGRYESDEWYQHKVLGYNYRLSEMSCALGCVQMQRIDDILARREAVALKYHENLRGQKGVIVPPTQLDQKRISWFVYVIRLASGFQQADRDAIVQSLGADGISCGRYFAPIHKQPAYQQFAALRSLPVTESLSTRTVALPFFNRITDSEIEYVCSSLVHLATTASLEQ